MKLAARIAISVGLLAYVLSLADWRQLAPIWADLRAIYLLPVAAVMVTKTALSSLKWQLFLRADGIEQPLLRLFSTYLIGSFFSCFLPTSMGGDIYRVLDVKRAAGASKSLSAVMLERLTGFLALSLVGLTAVLLGSRIEPLPDVRWAILAVFTALLGGLAVLASRRGIALIAGAVRALGWHRGAELVEGIGASVAAYRKRPRMLAAALAISCAQQLLVVFSIYLMALALRLEIAFIYFLIFIPVIAVVEALPISIFGLGVRDVSYVYLFTKVGQTPADCVALSLLYVSLSLLYASIGGVVHIVRQYRRRPGPAEVEV